MKATDVIRRDHRAAEELFEKYKKANHEDRAHMVDKIFEVLDTHEKMEDTHFYPKLEQVVEDEEVLKDMEREQRTLEEETARVKEKSGDRDDDMQSLMEQVLQHAKKEERDILPLAEKSISAEELEELGDDMEPDSAVAASEKE